MEFCEGATFGEDGSPLVVALLKRVRHLGGGSSAEETREERDSRHRLEHYPLSKRLQKSVRRVWKMMSSVTAEVVEAADDGRDTHRGL